MLREEGASAAAALVGSRAKLAAALTNAPIDEVINGHRPKPYRLGRVGDNAGMNDAYIREALAGEKFQAFFNGATGAQDRFAVACLTPADRVLFGCKGSALWLSRRSLDEHRDKHPEISVEDYRAIPDIVKNGEVWAGHSPRRYLLLWIGGKPYRAAIKTDAKGEEAWFLSLVVSGKQKPPKGAVRVR